MYWAYLTDCAQGNAACGIETNRSDIVAEVTSSIVHREMPRAALKLHSEYHVLFVTVIVHREMPRAALKPT